MIALVLFLTIADTQTVQPSIATRVSAVGTLNDIGRVIKEEEPAPTAPAPAPPPTSAPAASQKPAAPPPKKSPIIAAWLLLHKHFPNVETIVTDKTDNGQLSVALLATNKPQYLSNLVIHYTREPAQSPPQRCNTIASEPVDVFNKCCFRANQPAPQFSTDCLNSIDFAKLDNPLARGVFRIGTYLGVLHLFGAEIARKSSFIPNDYIDKKLAPGNTLFYVWSMNVDPGHGMMTVLDDELVDRIATTAYHLLPRMYFAVGSPSAGPAPYYQCSAAGIQRVITGWKPQGPPSLVISRGQPVSIFGPPGQTLYSSLVFYRDADGSLYFRLEPTSAPANSGPKSSFATFIASTPDGQEAFPCMPAGTTAALKQYTNQFNQPESTVFYFYMFYLDAAFEEFLNVLKLAQEAPKENVDLSPLVNGLRDVIGGFIPIPGFKP